MRIFCIADKESSLGFKLAGIELRQVSTQREAKEALKVALAMENMGIIFVTTKVARLIKEDIERLTYEDKFPLIIDIPSKGETEGRKPIGKFLKEAIGISI
ncbi:MAG: V-type ATP synthase subunit F [Candidatus Omnitrophica bacterium]|nr:V-type ATP synthase subunit F [Candidatus Omnitrophota bacterium]